MKQCTPTDVLNGKTPANAQYIDVREAGEYVSKHWPKFANMPLSGIQAALSNLDKKRPVVVMCLSGGRSMSSSAVLDSKGFAVWNVQGGISAAQREGAPIQQAESKGILGALKGMFA